MHTTLRTLALIALLSLTGWTRDAGRLPLRQIDRSLILPKGMWQERLTWSEAFSPGEEDLDQEKVQGFLPNLPSWSITDNLSWTAVPFPLFRYLLTRNNIQPGTRPAATDLSLALDGGLIAAMYSSRDGFEAYSTLGLSFKKPFSPRLWSEGSVTAVFSNADPAMTIESVGLGIQLTNRIHSLTGYTSTQLFRDEYGVFDVDNYRIYHGATQQFGINFHPGLSLDISATVFGGEGRTWVNPAAALSFQW